MLAVGRITSLLSLAIALFAQSQPPVQQPDKPQKLFQQLQAPDTTDHAAAQLLTLAKSDPRIRKYLAVRLPPVIDRGPIHPQAWSNAVRIAGELQMVDAVPPLARWIAYAYSEGATTLTQAVRLEDHPAAKALASIGEPSVPALAAVLTRGTTNERWEAAFVLHRIDSVTATQVLQRHLNNVEPDATLRDFISRALEKTSKRGR